MWLRALLLLLSFYSCHVSAVTYPVPTQGNSVIGEVQYITAGDEDTLLSLGRQYRVGYNEMVAANPTVDIWLPGAGTRIVIPSRYILPDVPHVGIVVNVAEQRIYYFPSVQPGDVPVVKTFPVSIGKMDWKTPLGLTRIIDKRIHPTWYPPLSVRNEHAARGEILPAVVPPGPNNPLGEFAMRLGIAGGAYLIHGTNKPTAIGMDVTHGCIRMFPEDIEAFFKEVPINTPVMIIDQPYKMGWSGNELYIETHSVQVKGQASVAPNMTELTRLFVSVTKQHPVRLDWQGAEQAFMSASGLPIQVKVFDEHERHSIKINH